MFQGGAMKFNTGYNLNKTNFRLGPHLHTPRNASNKASVIDTTGFVVLIPI